jgi:hypothetical protein
MRTLLIAILFGAFGALRLPIESTLTRHEHALHLEEAPLNLNLRQQIGQLPFLGALTGFRSVVADGAFIQAQVAWQQTQWARVLLCLREATTLQPRSILFWEMAAWHMGWNASLAALQDPSLPNDTLRRRAEREYFDLGKDFLEQGIRSNPRIPQLHEALARLYREKYRDHAAAARCYAEAASLPGGPEYDRRFAAYELSHVPGREREAYRQLRGLYDRGEEERLPTLLRRLKYLEEKLDIPLQERIPATEM